jgi:hypothetical protein
MNKTAPALIQGVLDVTMELTRVGELFALDGSPSDELVRYNGKRVRSDEQRCLMIGALKLLRCSDREIARVVGCDVRTIAVVIEDLERSGRIPALKERLTRWTAENAEQSQIVLSRLLARGAAGEVDIDLAAMIKSVGTVGGINTTNLQLLTGQATEIVDVRVAAGREEIERWARDNNVIDLVPSDVQADGLAMEHQQKQGVSAGDASHDARSGGASAEDGQAGGGVATGHLPVRHDPLDGSQNFGKEAA